MRVVVFQACVRVPDGARLDAHSKRSLVRVLLTPNGSQKPTANADDEEVHVTQEMDNMKAA